MALITKNEYAQMDEKYGDSLYKLCGPTLLGYPFDVDSSRLFMFTSNIRQILDLINPDVPRVATGYENVIGRYNRAYKQLPGTWKVVDKIDKFKNGQIYTLILYNEKTDTYDMIEKQVAENLTERFGYVYNTDVMDNLVVGQSMTDEIIYRSTSYDQNMNYRFGKNAKVYYSSSNDTLEDAVKIRQSWADGVKTVEVDQVRVPINNNDILLNLYGDDNTYKTFPEIGEIVKNSVLCASRRINKDHLLYDFQAQHMREIYSTDVDYYTSKNSMVYDIDVYYNGDDPFPDNIFFHQLGGYYKDTCEYAGMLHDWAKKIKKSGSKYTDNIPFVKSKYQHFNDPDYKWKNRDKVFGNIIVEFKVKAIVGLDAGSKIVGRYGDKGVISQIVQDTNNSDHQNALTGTLDCILTMLGKELTDEERAKLAEKIQIVPDEKMPYTDDYPVDILLNSSGAIRRLNTGQLDEVDLTFAAEQIRKEICRKETMEEKEALIFDFLELINKDEYNFFYEMYRSFDTVKQVGGYNVRFLNKKAKEDFIHDVEVNGFYIVKPPQSNIRYDTIKAIYERFDFIKPLPLYIDIFGTKHRRIIKDGIVGDKYMMVLKQNTNKNFSARSTFRVNRANLPAKDTTKRDNRAQFSHSPVRIGEAYNLMCAISGRDLAEYNIPMRSSLLGRKSLKSIISATGNPLAIKRIQIKHTFTNANADILNARLKGIGIRLDIRRAEDPDSEIIYDEVGPLTFDGYTIFDSPLKKKIYMQLFREYKKYMSAYTIIETYHGEAKDFAWKFVFDLPEIKALDISDGMKNAVIAATKNTGGISDTPEITPESQEETEEETE